MNNDNPKYPPKHRLRQLRIEQKLSMSQLGDRIGRPKTFIYKLEKGLARYHSREMNALAEALGVPPEELLKDEIEQQKEPNVLISEDEVSPCEQSDFDELEQGLEPSEADDPRRHFLDLTKRYLQTNDVYMIETEAVNETGVVPGNIAVFHKTSSLNELQDGDIVLAEISDSTARNGIRLIVRQFLAPSLLTPNSSNAKFPLMNMKDTKVRIRGFMITSYRFRGGRSYARVGTIRAPRINF